MIEFYYEDDKLILIYTPRNGTDWLYDKLNNEETQVLKYTFILKKEDLYSKEILEGPIDFFNKNDSIEFVIGHLVGEYYKIKGNILEIEQDLFIDKNMQINKDLFIAPKNISIIRKLGKIVKGDIYIGGNNKNSLPEEIMKRLIKDFPNSNEIKKYVDSRINVIVGDYFEDVVDANQKYENYMNSKISVKGEDLYEIFRNIELQKYIKIRKKLDIMLEASDGDYSEKQWQKEILQILRLIFPKYIYVFDEVSISDSYRNTFRSLDYLLVDSIGNVDIVEIKKPYDSIIVTKNVHRDNYIPMKELSGTVMQVEKYIFHLNKWGKNGEDFLSRKYRDKLPENFKIKITNPSGIIVMGREINLSSEQRMDFEIIKRQYKNIVDIITYDDLLNRLSFMIEQLGNKHEYN